MLLEFLHKTKVKIRDWSVEHIRGTRARFWLAALSFSEASFFLVPPDVLLIAILAVNSQRWLFYSSFTTIFSVLGGIFGYFLGFQFFDVVGQNIIDFYNLENQMKIVSAWFDNNAFLTIFVSALTPIPYKVFTLSAGFFKINFAQFIAASILGRGLRFFAVGYVMKKYGKNIVNYFFKYFDIISVVVVLVIAIYLFFRYFV